MSDDLIKKQAAIDALNAEGITKNMRAHRRILSLPSAQPEIIRCKDCKHASPDGKYGCKVYHFKLYETHEMKADDFCSKAERRTGTDDNAIQHTECIGNALDALDEVKK